MDKKGAINWGVLALIGVLIIGYMMYTAKPATTTITGTQGGTYISTGSTTLTLSAVDAAQTGVTVGATTKYSVNGGAYGTGSLSLSSLSPGNALNILVVNNTQYHNGVLKGYSVPSAPSDTKTVALDKNASVTEYILAQGTNTVLTNGGGAVNQTVSSGQSVTLKDEMFGTQLASTEALVCIVEATDGSQLTTSPPGVTLNGANPFSTAKPNFYTGTSANSNYYLFNVPALTNSNEVDYSLSVNTAVGKTLSGTKVIKDCYTKENFVDPVTGVLGNDIQDSNGALVSIAHYKYTVQFQ